MIRLKYVANNQIKGLFFHRFFERRFQVVLFTLVKNNTNSKIKELENVF